MTDPYRDNGDPLFVWMKFQSEKRRLGAVDVYRAIAERIKTLEEERFEGKILEILERSPELARAWRDARWLQTMAFEAIARAFLARDAHEAIRESRRCIDVLASATVANAIAMRAMESAFHNEPLSPIVVKEGEKFPW